MIEVDQQLTEVRREVGGRVLEAGEARTVTLSQSYAGTVDDLWDACTNPVRIPRWFLPISGDLRVGGRYQLDGNAGGEVLTCEPPRSFTATWEFGDSVSWIEVTVSADGDRARLQLVQIIEVGDDTWEQYGPGAVGMGWDMALVGLALHLGGGDLTDPASSGAGAAWGASPDGLRYLRGSGEGWYEADVASGTAAEVARATADRCIAAYTEPPPSEPPA